MIKLPDWISNWNLLKPRYIAPAEETGWIIRGEKGTSFRLDRDDMLALTELIIKQKNLNLLSGRRCKQ